MPKTYFIKTYGCQMNFADSDKYAAVFEQTGYQITDDEKSADIILVNTCVVRQHAEDRAAGFINSIKVYKKRNPSIKIILCGCFVTEPGRNVKNLFPHADLFLPPHSSEKLREFLSSPLSAPAAHSFSSPLKMERGAEAAKGRRGGVRFVTIMHGCDNFCSYCVVPYVRGRETSRPMDEVLAEIKDLVEQGTTDITLLGQNVNSYKSGLARLLREIHQLVISHSSLVIRFMTSHPRDMSDEIIQAVAELPFVSKEFNLPLQSGNDQILEKMNRGYTYSYYLNRVKKIRELIPDAMIITDLLVGFPGETEEQFENTLKAVVEVKFRETHMFAYSPRPGTAAAQMPEQLPEEVIQERLQKLINLNRQVVRK